MHDWNAWDKLLPIDYHAMQIIRMATEENPTDYRSDKLYHHSWLSLVDDHRRHCAYRILTHQPLTCRKVNDERTERKIIAWRIVQFILFILLFFGIYPTDWEEGIILSRGWILTLFLCFAVTSTLCRFYEKAYKQYQRETSVLNAIVTEDDIAAYLRTEECAEMIHKEREHPDCKFWRELDTYLYWYETKGKESQQGNITKQ